MHLERSTLRPFVVRWAIVVILSFAGFACEAHDPGLSSANITIAPDEVTIDFAFAADDVKALEKSTFSTPETIAEWKTGEQIVVPSVAPSWRQVEDNIELRLTFPRGAGASATFRSAVVSQLPFGHRQMVTVRDSAGVLLGSHLLSGQQETVEIPLSPAAGASPQPVSNERTFIEFLVLGIEHILIGYDHLLFLFALLLVCERFGSAVTLITCFTVAHSITLGLATFNVVALPSRLVESLIAASVIYVGLENLLAKRPLRWRWVLTFSFGLLHGLGFAGVLRELGVGSGGGAVALPLFSFNLGVELGQIAVAAATLPILLLLRRKPSFVRVGIPATSIVMAGVGAYWLIDRAMS